MKQFPIDSRTLHEDLDVKSKHADWVRNFIHRLRLEEGDDYITYRDGKKHIYKFTEDVLQKLEDNAKGSALTELCIPTSDEDLPEGFVYYNGDIYLPSTALASYAEKRHSNVLRDIDVEIAKLKSALESKESSSQIFNHLQSSLAGFVESSYTSDNGGSRKRYLLDFKATLHMASKYSVEVRSMLVNTFVEQRHKALSDLKVLREGVDNLSHRHVYILQGVSSGQYKIGVASKPESRAANLSTSTEDVEVVWSSGYIPQPFQAEKSAHQAFKAYKTRKEWFDETLPVLDVIEHIKQQGEFQ